MSIWYCKRRDVLTGPMACCSECEYTVLDLSDVPYVATQTVASTMPDNLPLNLNVGQLPHDVQAQPPINGANA